MRVNQHTDRVALAVHLLGQGTDIQDLIEAVKKDYTKP
jgi:hypothetical protein